MSHVIRQLERHGFDVTPGGAHMRVTREGKYVTVFSLHCGDPRAMRNMRSDIRKRTGIDVGRDFGK